jgi:hypothetical protein
LLNHSKNIIGTNINRYTSTTIKRWETVISGHEFNAIAGNRKFYKFISEDREHYDYKFPKDKVGIFEDNVPFNDKHCCKGGLHFTNDVDSHIWVKKYVREVKVLDESKVSIGFGKFKADKLYLGEERPLNEEYNKELCRYIVKRDGSNIQFIDNPSLELQLLALDDDENYIDLIEKPYITTIVTAFNKRRSRNFKRHEEIFPILLEKEPKM